MGVGILGGHEFHQLDHDTEQIVAGGGAEPGSGSLGRHGRVAAVSQLLIEAVSEERRSVVVDKPGGTHNPCGPGDEELAGKPQGVVGPIGFNGRSPARRHDDQLQAGEIATASGHVAQRDNRVAADVKSGRQRVGGSEVGMAGEVGEVGRLELP